MKIRENTKRGLGECRRPYKGRGWGCPGRGIAGAGRAQRARERPWRRSVAGTERGAGAGSPEGKGRKKSTVFTHGAGGMKIRGRADRRERAEGRR